MKKLSFNQMESVAAGSVTKSIGCGVLMTMAAAPWSVALSVFATPLAGYAFDLGWTAFSGWVCSR